MSNKTSIAWTDVTDNIIVVEGGGWWCRMISLGCAHCYAAALNQSAFFGGNRLPYSGEPPKLKLRTDIIDGWERQKHPKRHFVASMTDVFGEWVTFQMVVTFMRGMWRAPKQTFQIPTKRPAHMARMIGEWLKLDGLAAVPDNIWLGVSAENQEMADERIPILLSIPAKVRFVSVEPMLGPVDLDLYVGWKPEREAKALQSQVLRDALKSLSDIPGVDWVIVGGESGAYARPCHADWIRRLVSQCRKTGVPVFVKQAGRVVHEFAEYAHCRLPGTWGNVRTSHAPGDCMVRVHLNHPKGGDPAEWPAEFQVRESPA
jgi:protein gp37